MAYMNSEEIFSELFRRYPALEVCRHDIRSAYEKIGDSFESGGKLLCCGNGGSSADCDHIVGELMKGFLLKRPVRQQARNGDAEILSHLQGTLPAISLTAQSALLTAFSNDLDFDHVYAQQVFGLASEGDVLLALSTSGNSPSVVNAVRAAAAIGVTTVSITGEKESELSRLSDVTVKLPESETFKIQEYTLPVYHCLCAMLERDFFTE